MKKHKKILKKLGHILFRTFETCVAFIVVIFSLILYQLHENPMDAKNLIHEIEKSVFPSESGYHLDAKTVVLGVDLKKEGIVQLEISDLQVLRSDESVVLSVPEVRLAYDFWHIVTLNFTVPSTILLKQPYMNMILPDFEKLPTSESESLIQEKKIKKIVNHILSFKHIDIQEGKFILKEEGSSDDFTFDNFNLNLSRSFGIHEKIHFSSDLTYAGQTTRLLLDGIMNKFTKDMDLELGFPSIYLKPLGRFFPILAGLDFPVQVLLKGRINLPRFKETLSAGVQKLNFQIKANSGGTLNLPAPLTNAYPMKELEINGVLTKGCQLLKVASSYLLLTSGTRASLNATITGIDQFLKSNHLKDIKTNFTSTVTDVDTAELPNVWPSEIGHSTHEWVKTHLSQGKMDYADFRLYFEGDELVDLYGDVYAHGVRVDYLPPMLPVQDVKARIELFPDTVKIDVAQGHVNSLQIAGTKLLFTDVDIDPSWAKVNLKASGLVKDIFQLLSSKPLEFTQEYGIDSVKSKGEALLETELFFKLDTESEPDEVKVDTEATISNAKIVFKDLKFVLDQSFLDLELNNQKMHVSGKAEVFEMPLSIDWLEYFEPQNNLSSSYQAKGTFSTTYLKDLYPNIEKFVSGNLTVSASAQKFSDARGMKGQLEIDTKDSLVHLYPLGVEKTKGKELLIQADFEKKANKDLQMTIKALGDMNQKEDLKIQGEFHLGKEMKLNFPTIQAPQTHLNLFFQENNNDFILKVKGKDWNATKILSMPTDLFAQEMLNDQYTRNVLWDIQMDQVVFDTKNPIKNMVIKGQRLGKDWQSFHAQAQLKEPFILIFDEENRQFKGAYKNLGNLMESFGFQTSISEGEMVLTADQKESGEIKGKIQIETLKLKDPGFMTQALTILGILDAFMGKDIVFDKVDIPILLNLQNQFFIQDGQASGTNLGLTFKGKIFGNELDLQGSLVPAYAINSLPGKIPVVGWLFKNTEGGGLINVPFTVQGTLGAPQIDFSILKTMTPGFLGKWF